MTHEKWAVGVAVAAVVTPFISIAMYSTGYGDPWTSTWWWNVVVRLLGGLLTNLAVGTWLWFIARRDGNSSATWFALGLVFSIIAVVLYFLLRVLESKHPQGTKDESAA